MQIYGPSGLRKFVRVNLQLTLTELRGRYVVHELLGPSDEPSVSCEKDLLHFNENPGNSIRADEHGLWKSVLSDKDWTVNAGPLQHRGAHSSTNSLFRVADIYIPRGAAPCVGYVFQEGDRYAYQLEHYVPGRKIVILGDTYDSRGIMPLCYDADLLVHEATQMAIPRELAYRVPQLRKGCSEEEARKAAQKHGHSTAAMAGEFAKEIRAKKLCLNHFSVKYAPRPSFSYVSTLTDRL